jgi:transposase InsO family protein
LPLLDVATRYLEIRLIKSKDNIYPTIVEAKSTIEEDYNSLNKDIKNRKLLVFKTDNDREFKNKKLNNFLLKNGIRHELSAPYTHEQNDLIERYNRIILNITRSLLKNSNLSRKF